MAPAMPQVDGVQHRYADVDGLRMHYAEAGDPAAHTEPGEGQGRRFAREDAEERSAA